MMEIKESGKEGNLLKIIKEAENLGRKRRQNEKMDKISRNILRVVGTGAAIFTGYLSYQYFSDEDYSGAINGSIVTASMLFYGYLGYGIMKEIYDMYLTPKEIKEYEKNKKSRINLN